MIDVNALRSACLAGDFLESVRRPLSAELDKHADLGAAASAGDVARIAAWVAEETPLLEVIGPLVTRSRQTCTGLNVQAADLEPGRPDGGGRGAVRDTPRA